LTNSNNDGDGDILGNNNNNNNNNTVATTTTTAAQTTATSTTTTHSFVNPKFSLQYTCNVCETKNRVLVSRQAYREGMVVAICKGCDTKHWIADNLDPTLKETPNIEDYLLLEQEKKHNKTEHKQSKESSSSGEDLSMESGGDNVSNDDDSNENNSKNNSNVVHRVSKEVYEIERIWGLKEGVLTDDSGKTVLE